jgi:hypothetical protein
MYTQLASGAVSGVAAATQAGLAKKADDKVTISREETLERKAANALLMREMAMAATGKQSFADKLRSKRTASAVAQGIAIQDSTTRRAAGRMGVEGPGLLLGLQRNREQAVQSMVAANNANQMAQKGKAIPIAQALLAENQPFTKSKTKRGKTWAKVLSAGAAGFAGGFSGGGGGAATKGPQTKTTGVVSAPQGQPSQTIQPSLYTNPQATAPTVGNLPNTNSMGGFQPASTVGSTGITGAGIGPRRRRIGGIQGIGRANLMAGAA